MFIDEVSRDEFIGWQNNPVTKAIIKALIEERERLNDMLTNGSTLEDTNGIAKTARYVGAIYAFDCILALKYEEVEVDA